MMAWTTAATKSIVRFGYRRACTPARALRLLRAPSLAEAVGDRVVLVTGASSGIGRATARRFGLAGATVLLVARPSRALDAAAAEVAAAGGRAHVHPCDLRDPAAVDRLAAEIIDCYGGVDVLVNNAGRSIRRPVDESYDRLHDFERTMRLNYFAATQLILGLLPSMRERRRGHIINICTLAVQTNAPMFSAYIASKAALDALSRSLAAEVRDDGVRITTIHPPIVHTPMVAPSGHYDDAPGLTADEAADMIAEAVRTKPAYVSTQLGTAMELVGLLAPAVVQAAQSRAYRRSLETERRIRSSSGAHRPVHGLSMAA